ncbi:MAG: hypothetical protein IH619_00155 [Ignavibacterium sp.]|nr:hypothetical protein [Ignavibacterium sp.]
MALAITSLSEAQTLSRKDFVNTEWFSDNTDSLFFKSDTIWLIQYSNVYIKGKGYNIFHESSGIGDNLSVKYIFKKGGEVDFWIRQYDKSSVAKAKERKWEYLRNEGTIRIIKDDFTEYSFKILAINDMEFLDDGKIFLTKVMTVKKKINNH